MELIERDTFYIYGYAVETTAEQNDADVSRLFADFFDAGKDAGLRNLHGTGAGYYGLLWYTQGHEKYCYLLGVEADENNPIPAGALKKELCKTTFAVEHFPKSKDAIEAWTEFFYTDIPKEGLAPNAQYNMYFEYYPEDVDGDYQLWVPVVKADG